MLAHASILEFVKNFQMISNNTGRLKKNSDWCQDLSCSNFPPENTIRRWSQVVFNADPGI